MLLSIDLIVTFVWRVTFRGNFKVFLLTVIAVMILGMNYLVPEWIVINRHIKQQRKTHPLLPYLSALVETCIPLAALLITAQYMGPAYVLLTPAPFVYPLLIVLSVLRLDFKLSVFTGAVAAVQYWIMSLILMR